MAKSPLIVLGSGGNALDAFDTIRSRFEIVAFIDDNPAKVGGDLCGIPIKSRAALDDFPDAKVISIIGSENTFSIREKIFQGFNLPIDRYATIVDESAFVSSLSSIGKGVLLLPGVVIPSNASIGDHVIVLPNSVIHHDAVVDDYCIIGSHVVVAGSVKIGKSTYVGSGSTIKNGISIGAGSLLGMSANVVRDCPEGSVMVGNPARMIRKVGS
ncbi:MAG: NeuD/PglB/VioB family sugar acetyltransferase [Rhizobiaceae bacterium]|nr:NeuD/PglB/VioB family sugar acetyltransferase [Rhizobiaceae bacterium]